MSEPTAPPPSFWTEPRGVRTWLATTDHKRIAILFFVGTALALMLGGTFALILRVELVVPDHGIVGAHAYDKLFTHHGIVMVWMFMIPAIPGVFGNFLVPLMIGANELAFPRLNRASFWVYATGACITLAALIGGGVDTGWTFYTPYSTTTPTAVAVVCVGVFVLGISSVMTGLNFIVTVHTRRAPSVPWMKLPLFVWTIYATSIILVLATPVLGLSLALVGADHVWHLGLFDPAAGGDPVLFQHLFWFYSHPAVYIMVLPAMGVVSEVVSTFAHNRPASYGGIVVATIGIALVGFFTWGHHMFVAGMSMFDTGMFGALSMFVAVFSAIKMFAWVITFYRGRVVLAAPVLYVFTFLFLFLFGGMTGVAVATSSLDVHWHDTYFIVAHFHFIMVGATLTAYLAALHYWFPKLTGRRYSEVWARRAAVAVALGFVGTFLPQFLLGNAGMPRRYYAYPEEWQWLHVASTCGAGLLALGLGTTLVYLGVALRRGPPSGDDPWQSRGFEWRTPSPPPAVAFSAPPVWERDAYSYEDEVP